MFMILPTNKENSIPVDEPSEEVRTRVKKACNRCRIKKSKCDGRMPCARCERDRTVCRADTGPRSGRELSRNYIASLEEQQLSLLSALKELYHESPHDDAVRETMRKLQARGFDVGPVRPPNPTVHANAPETEHEVLLQKPEQVAWDNNGISMDTLEALLAQPATPQVVSEFLCNFSDSSGHGAFQQDMLMDSSYVAPQSIFTGPQQDYLFDPAGDQFNTTSNDYSLNMSSMQYGVSDENSIQL